MKQLTSIASIAISSNRIQNISVRSPRLYEAGAWVLTISLICYAVFAPHSIAITEGAFIVGLAGWILQIAATRKLIAKRTPVDIALFSFFACCIVSSFLSYDPLVSVKGLKSPALFLAFYVVSHNVRSRRFATFLALAIIVSSLVSVGYSGVKLAIGRGLQIDSVKPESAFANDSIRVGDVILEADDQRVESPEELMRIIDSQRGRLRLKLQRREAVGEISIPRQAIKESSGVGFERLGITTSPGRNFRVQGFYSHYETYAEVLQLIAALAVGLLIAAPTKNHRIAWFLSVVILLLATTLILTSTRAALAGVAIASVVMAVASARRRVMLTTAASILIVFPLALLSVERSRGISLFDLGEGSTAYRLEVWREAFGIIKDNPVVGIGKGSEAKLKASLGLYDEGRLPPGHFHSTQVQVAVWWGLLGLISYCAFMFIFAREIWRVARSTKSEPQWQVHGIALGGLGAIVAFNVSSIVHFNFGDGEVVMAFWLMTGLAFAIRRIAVMRVDAARSAQTSAQPSIDSSQRNPSLLPEAASGPGALAAKVKQH